MARTPNTRLAFSGLVLFAVGVASCAVEPAGPAVAESAPATPKQSAVAQLLERIRAASDDFTLPDWACNSYRTLFSELEQLEGDVFTHVHLENHVLRPRFATQ